MGDTMSLTYMNFGAVGRWNILLPYEASFGHDSVVGTVVVRFGLVVKKRTNVLSNSSHVDNNCLDKAAKFRVDKRGGAPTAMHRWCRMQEYLLRRSSMCFSIVYLVRFQL